MSTEKVKVCNEIYEVEFDYEKSEPESGYEGGYTLYEINNIPAGAYSLNLRQTIINKLEEIRNGKIQNTERM